jgi:hypothetical protein
MGHSEIFSRWLNPQRCRSLRGKPLPKTTPPHLSENPSPEYRDASILKAEVRRFTASGATVFDRARLDAAVTRFLGAAS